MGAHEERVVDAHEVLALDQFDAHLLREEDVLEERRVAGPGREERGPRPGDVPGRDLPQAREELGR